MNSPESTKEVTQSQVIMELKRKIQVSHSVLRELGRKCSLVDRVCNICAEVEAVMQLTMACPKCLHYHGNSKCAYIVKKRPNSLCGCTYTYIHDAAPLPQPTAPPEKCSHECGLDGFHDICECAKCGAKYPTNKEVSNDGASSGNPAVAGDASAKNTRVAQTIEAEQFLDAWMDEEAAKGAGWDEKAPWFNSDLVKFATAFSTHQNSQLTRRLEAQQDETRMAWDASLKAESELASLRERDTLAQEQMRTLNEECGQLRSDCVALREELERMKTALKEKSGA